MKKHMICITGNIAVGKSEVSRYLAELLDFRLYKASDSFRETARNMNMSLVEFCEYAAKNPNIDRQIEQKTKEVVESSENMIVDARLGFYVAPNSFKVYMTADLDVAAKRLFIASKTRGKEEEYATEAEAKQAIIAREKTEKERYKELYGVDVEDILQFDLVIDTTNLSSLEVANKIVKAYKEWEGK